MQNKRETPVFQSSLHFSVKLVPKQSAWTKSPWLRDWEVWLPGDSTGTSLVSGERWAELVACWCFSTKRLLHIPICPSLSNSQELHFHILILLSTASNFWGDEKGRHMELCTHTDLHTWIQMLCFTRKELLAKARYVKRRRGNEKEECQRCLVLILMSS